MTVTGHQIVDLAEKAKGDRYIFGTEVTGRVEDARAFDCSELVEAVCRELGVQPPMPDGSNNQRLHCVPCSVDHAIHTAGALMFIGGNATHHVAISRGDGTTIEARGRAWPVGNFTAYGRFDRAGLIPGVDYNPRPQALPIRQALAVGASGRVVEIAQWELAAISGARFDGESGVYLGRVRDAVVNLGRILGKAWDGMTIGPDQWVAIDFLYKRAGHDPVIG